MRYDRPRTSLERLYHNQVKLMNCFVFASVANTARTALCSILLWHQSFTSTCLLWHIFYHPWDCGGWQTNTISGILFIYTLLFAWLNHPLCSYNKPSWRCPLSSCLWRCIAWSRHSMRAAHTCHAWLSSTNNTVQREGERGLIRQKGRDTNPTAVPQ